MTRGAPYLVGLTGGLGSGKSTLARRLTRHAGIAVADADRLVAESYRPGEPGAAAVRDLFGDDALDAAGAVDVSRLAERVFRDAEARRALERRVHPLVRQRFARFARECGAGVVVLEATLLVEAGFAPDFDWLVAVEAPEQERLRRAVVRGLAEPAARARLEAQGDGRARRAAAHRILHNEGDLAALESSADDLARELLARARLASAGAAGFVLVTGNAGKRAEAERLLGVPLDTAPLDLPEIQSLDLEEVLRGKLEEAWSRLRRPLVVEETGLSLRALGGFPGPLVRWMLEAAGADGIARTALALEDAAAEARSALAWTDGESTLWARGATTGRLVQPARGGHGFGWDPVFLPDPPAGWGLTYGEMLDAEKDAISHRGRAWRDLLGQLSAR